MNKLLEGLSKVCARVTGFVVVALAFGLTGSILVSIFFRYVVGQALSWPEEISLILFAWLVLLAGSLGVRENFHVRLTVFTDRLPRQIQYVLGKAVDVALGIFGGVLVYSGYDLVSRTAKHLTPTLRLPLDWLNYAAPVCGFLIVLHSLPKLWETRSERPDP